MADLEFQRERRLRRCVEASVGAVRTWVEMMSHRRDGSVASNGLSRRRGHAPSAAADLRNAPSAGGAEVTAPFEDALGQLSLFLTEDPGQQDVVDVGVCPSNDAVDGTYEESKGGLVDAVASIPSLVETIFLIDDGRELERVMRYTVIRRAMLNRYSILTGAEPSTASTSNSETTAGYNNGISIALSSPADNRNSCWLIQMLENGSSSIRKRAVMYLEVVSQISPMDWIGDSGHDDCHKPRLIETDLYMQQRDGLFDEICGLKKLVPLLLTLSDREIERAGTTSVIQLALDRTLGRPFGVTFVFLDLCANSICLIIYSVISGYVVNNCRGGECNEFDPPGYATLVNWNIGVTILYYLTFREVSKATSMWMISRRVFRAYLISFWTLVDVGSLAMVYVIISTRNLTMESPGHTTFVAISKGFLWLRLLGFLKVVNKDLSTFVLTVIEILKDVRWFVIVLFLVIVAFADMMFTTVSVNRTCSNVDSNSFCESWALSMLEVYKVFVGDVGLEDYEVSAFTRVLFVLLTFFGVIILLTMLIAIVNESYEKCKVGSEGLFGKARLSYVADLVALESLLRPTRACRRGNMRHCLLSAHEWLRVVFRSIVWAFYVLFGVGLCNLVAIAGTRAIAILVGVLLGIVYAAFGVIFTYLIIGWGGAARSSKCFRCVQNSLLFRFCIRKPATAVVQFLFGRTIRRERDPDGETKKWHGRLKFIEESTQQTVSDAEQRVNKKILRLENCLETLLEMHSHDTQAILRKLDDLEMERRRANSGDETIEVTSANSTW